MGKRVALRAQDELERQLLLEVAAAPDGKERAAIEALTLPRRDRVDDMWAGSPIRVSEARKIATWLGYELRLVRLVKFSEAPAYKDHAAFLRAKAQRKARAAPRDKRRAASSSR